jgi:hypothetical protein
MELRKVMIRHLIANGYEFDINISNDILVGYLSELHETQRLDCESKYNLIKRVLKITPIFVTPKNVNTLAKRKLADNLNDNKLNSMLFYESNDWKTLRYKAIVMYGNKCMCCGRSPKDNITIHVDHIKPKSKFPNLKYDINNLQILCHECNEAKSNIDQTDWR